MNRKTVLHWALDLVTCLAAAVIGALSYHSFSNCNGFAPGGISGVAYVVARLTGVQMAWFLLAFNIPIFILVSIFVHRRTGILLCFYTLANSGALLLLDGVGFPSYITQNNLIFACISAGMISGFGSSLMLRRFGAGGGTYAIAALIRVRRPAANQAWVAFFMDASVVVLIFFAFGNHFEAALCTLINLFIADYVVDYLLSGMKSGYKFEIVTDQPDELSRELMESLGRGVTRFEATGMYSHQGKSVLLCIVRKRQLSDMMRILRRHPGTFSSFTRVNEVFGKFVK